LLRAKPLAANKTVRRARLTFALGFGAHPKYGPAPPVRAYLVLCLCRARVVSVVRAYSPPVCCVCALCGSVCWLVVDDVRACVYASLAASLHAFSALFDAFSLAMSAAWLIGRARCAEAAE
jgi:hypothetical protein